MNEPTRDGTVYDDAAEGTIPITGSSKESWRLGLTTNRLTLLTLIVGVGISTGVTVGFGAGSALWGVVGFFGGLVATPLIVRALLGNGWVRTQLMRVTNWMAAEK